MGTYDDSSSILTYTGSWSVYAGSGPKSDTLHYSTSVGDYVSMGFEGQKLVLYYTQSTNRGIMDVYIDNILVDSVNGNGAMAWQQQKVITGLSAGTHTLKLQHASGAIVDIDAVSVQTPLDTTLPSAISDLSAAKGSSLGTVTLSWTAPGNDGSTGTASSYLVRYSSSAITGSNWVSATPVTSSIPTPQVAGTSQSMTVSGLTPGVTYYFAVRAQDAEPNLGAISNSPSAAAKSAGVGTYDDSSSILTYTGSWSVYAGSGPKSDTLHYSTSVGDYVSMGFEGQKLVLYYTQSTNRGNMDVYIDNILVDSVNENGALAWQQQKVITGLSAGTHTLKLQHASGTFVDIDAITVTTP